MIASNMWKTVLQVAVAAFLLLHAAHGKLENFKIKLMQLHDTVRS